MVAQLLVVEHVLNLILVSSHVFKEICGGGRGDAYTLSV